MKGTYDWFVFFFLWDCVLIRLNGLPPTYLVLLQCEMGRRDETQVKGSVKLHV